MRSALIGLLASGMLVASCGTKPTPVETTPVHVQLVSPTITGEATVDVYVTPASKATETPEPAVLNSSSPYVMFEGDHGIWIANPDGSSPTRVSDRGFVTPYRDPRRAISPGADRLAMIRTNENGADLVIIQIPGGETEIVTHLADQMDPLNMTSDSGLAYHAITSYDNLAWQPGEGRLLAFMGAMDGPTADLYTYDTQSGAITRLTDGLSQGLFPTWSPDGEYILHFGGSWVPPFGGALVGYNRADGAWAVRVSDGAVIRQPGELKSHNSFIGWLDDDHYLYSGYDEACGLRDIRSVDVGVATVTTVFKGCYDSYKALSPEDGVLLISSTACEQCPLGSGTFLIHAGEPEAIQVWPEKSWGIEWLPESQAFYAYPLGVVSVDGQMRYDSPVPEGSFHPAVSTDGWVAWQVTVDGERQVLVGLAGEQPLTLPIPARVMIWDPVDGDKLLMVTRGGTVYAASAPDFTPLVKGELGDWADQAIWIP